MIGWLLSAPALLVLALAFLWPMLGLFRISLNRTAETGAMETALTTETYAKVAGDPYYWGLAWDTLVLSAGAAAIAAALALPVVLLIRRASPRWRAPLALMAVSPLLISGTARVVGWRAILGVLGLINVVLGWLGLTGGPVPLRKYAGGGIANSPQLAMFGEGAQPEAYVPLPDGRRIPVAMQGSNGMTVNQTIYAGQGTDSAQVRR